MNTRFRVLPDARVLTVAVVLVLTLAGGVRAAEPSRAGLVVVYGQDDVHTSCVAFDSPEITGLELLQRSGLAVIQSSATGIGDSVCKIDAVGCDFPGEHCFCQCLGSPCAFWSYWYWQEGEWVFSQRGASLRRVSDGAVEAWVWGDGQSPPPAIEATNDGQPFAAICASPPQLSAPASQDGYPGPDVQAPGPTSAPGSYPDPDDGPEEPTPEPEPTATPEPEPTEEEPPEETPPPDETPEPEATATETPTPSATPTRATATPTATATAITPSPTPGPTATPTDDGMAAAIATAVARNRATPAVTGGGTGAGSYVAFALLALVLGALVVYAVLLRRQRAREEVE